MDEKLNLMEEMTFKKVKLNTENLHGYLKKLLGPISQENLLKKLEITDYEVNTNLLNILLIMLHNERKLTFVIDEDDYEGEFAIVGDYKISVEFLRT